MRDYRLSALQAEDAICVLGPSRILRDLMAFNPNKQIYHTDKGDEFVKIPATKQMILAAEAMAAPTYVSESYKVLRSKLLQPQSDLKLKWEANKPKLKREPMFHQNEFCSLAFASDGMLNASEQGTGKTMTMAMLIGAWRFHRNLIVTPPSIMRQWEYEIYSTLIDPPNVIILDSKYPINERMKIVEQFAEIRDERVIIVINYEVLDKMLPVFVKRWIPEVIIYDESWKIKNPKTLMSKAATKLSDKATKVMLATGTPVAQGPHDLWNQLRQLSTQNGKDMPSYNEWMYKFCRIVEITDPRSQFKFQKVIGCQNVVELMTCISNVYYRATKSTCLDLPPKRKHKIKLDMPPNVRKLYDAINQDGEAALNPESLTGQSVEMLRLQQLIGGFLPDDVDIEEVTKRYRLGEYLDCPKYKWIQDFVRDNLEGDPTVRMIVWCKFNKEVDRNVQMITKILGEDKVKGITGSGIYKTDNIALEEIKSSFNSKDAEGIQVLVVQTKKMAYGHNLQGCDVNIIFSNTWSFLERDQLEDRSHRAGRIGTVDYYDLLIKKSVDETIIKMHELRMELEDRLAPDTISEI